MSMTPPQTSEPGYHPPVPDAIDLVVEVEVMMAVFAAQKFERIDAMRLELLADTARRGVALTDVVERGVRLELAAALRVTESAAKAAIHDDILAMPITYGTLIGDMAPSSPAARSSGC